MADVSGPVNTLPGSVRNVTQSTTGIIMCDEHDDVPAVKRVQGETDSFGAEYTHMCQQCYDNYLVEASKPVAGYCDWGKHQSDDIKPVRDLDEGSCGPVYYACSACRTRAFSDFVDVYGDDF